VSWWRPFRLLAMLAVAAILLLALGRSANAEGAQSAVEASLHFFRVVTLSGKELQPGIYSLVANSSKVTLKQSGKVVAEAPVQWKDGDKKEFATHVVLDGNNIKEIRFAGRARYVVIQQWQLSAKCHMQSLKLGAVDFLEKLFALRRLIESLKSSAFV
jgi:hypothetical protein